MCRYVWMRREKYHGLCMTAGLGQLVAHCCFCHLLVAVRIAFSDRCWHYLV